MQAEGLKNCYTKCPKYDQTIKKNGPTCFYFGMYTIQNYFQGSSSTFQVKFDLGHMEVSGT